jgi:hypothetical protein
MTTQDLQLQDSIFIFKVCKGSNKLISMQIHLGLNLMPVLSIMVNNFNFLHLSRPLLNLLRPRENSMGCGHAFISISNQAKFMIRNPLGPAKAGSLFIDYSASLALINE